VGATRIVAADLCDTSPDLRLENIVISVGAVPRYEGGDRRLDGFLIAFRPDPAEVEVEA
jgi:hypothetical protein